MKFLFPQFMPDNNPILLLPKRQYPKKILPVTNTKPLN